MTPDLFSPEDVATLFTQSSGDYRFARWGRPIVPVVFGITDDALGLVKGAIEAVVAIANHSIAETDPEIGANLMVFFVRDWEELPAVPNLGKLVPDIENLCARLVAANANQYRTFRFDTDGAIKAAFVFVRMDEHLADLPAEVLALTQALRIILTWSDAGFKGRSPLVDHGAGAVLRAEYAALIRAAYLPALPAVAHDPSHALRLYARMVAAN